MTDAIAAAHRRIQPFIRETPLERASSLDVFYKLEHLQETGSFKFRGASNKVALLTPAQAAKGIVAASNGNHGLGVAAAARARGVEAEVYCSSHVSKSKARRIEQMGARIHYSGDDPLSAELAARRDAEQSGRVFISPYNDADVVAGQGTIGVELTQQLDSIDAVLVAAGGGGLIGGIGSWLKTASPGTEIVGCWPENSPVLLQCLEAGHVVEVEEQPTLSESTAGGLEPECITIDICRRVIDRSVLVSEDEILDAMRFMAHTEHWLVEGAAAVAVAAFRKEAQRYRGKNVVVVLCGRNLSAEVMTRLIA